MTPLPTLFISHGAPNLVLHKTPAHRFLAELAVRLPRPKAIVVISAHFMTAAPALTVDAQPDTIYDFGGFEPELHRLRYTAPGAPALAETCIRHLASHGITAHAVAGRGFDHGTWVPLMLLYPEADIPVVQLSVQPKAGPAHHLALGEALQTLAAEGILVIGSGALTHNLHEVFSGRHAPDGPAPDWVTQFGDWMHAAIQRNDPAALVAYRRVAPFAVENHPTEEHLLPLFAAMGAAGGRAGQRLHSSAEYGVLMMDVYGFGMPASAARSSV